MCCHLTLGLNQIEGSAKLDCYEPHQWSKRQVPHLSLDNNCNQMTALNTAYLFGDFIASNNSFMKSITQKSLNVERRYQRRMGPSELFWGLSHFTTCASADRQASLARLSRPTRQDGRRSPWAPSRPSTTGRCSRRRLSGPGNRDSPASSTRTETCRGRSLRQSLKRNLRSLKRRKKGQNSSINYAANNLG